MNLLPVSIDRLKRMGWLALLLALPPAATHAAVADLANGPIANGNASTTTIKPNIALVVDDSGSMDWDYMPDGQSGNRAKRCFGSPQYNGMAYNPGITYRPPYLPSGSIYSDGRPRFPNASFTKAYSDGYAQSGTTIDLSSRSNLSNGPSEDRYYYTTTTSTQSGCLDDSLYTAVIDTSRIAAPNVSIGSEAAKTNYANWYSYYRKRNYMMKAAAAESFSSLGDNYRVGLFFLNGDNSGSNKINSSSVELKIGDFTGDQRMTWYTNLFNAGSSGATPTRAALSRMGRMFAGKITDWDPVQYSCQQNFAIVTSDGYWNTSYENATYGPKSIDGTTDIGDVDGGDTPGVAATASVKLIGGDLNKTRYYAKSLLVTANGSSIQLLNDFAVPSSDGTTSRSTLTTSIINSINERTATTGYSAKRGPDDYQIIISAPLSAGAITATPSLTLVKANTGSRPLTYESTQFSGFVAATIGSAPIPYRDAKSAKNTLADIAYYYYNTDLRTTDLSNCSNTIGGIEYKNLCENNVYGTAKDNNTQQHMTTFTVGMGLSDQILYQPNYESNSTLVTGKKTYRDILNGTMAWPDPDTTNTESSVGVAGRVDDLWHAAVNGRGTYFSAADPTSLTLGLQNALSAIQARTGTSSAAATSTLEPVAGDNYVFLAQYTSMSWVGDVKALTIDPSTGEISTAIKWSAQTQLNNKVRSAGTGKDGRSIKYFSAAATDKLKEFNFSNLSADKLGDYFKDACSDSAPKLSQCGVGSSLSSTQKNIINSGDTLVNYLRGQATYEMKTDVDAGNRLLRSREHVLGDIVNGSPVYVSAPQLTYGSVDATYTAFALAKQSRGATVYVAANDGMLHAFDANSGDERWAFVPTAVMSRLYKLASANFSQNHEFYVDGTPTVADVCVNLVEVTTGNRPCKSKDDWRTILVGGLNKGGRGYYALDITDPTSPKALWEFTEKDMGYSYGNPVITRKKDGTWVVLFTSGYNNVPGVSGMDSSSDGKGYLYVVDAMSGSQLDKIGTGTGDLTTPSNLGKINAWVDDPARNVASVVYGGDLLGNIWRFDFDDNAIYPPAGKEVMLLANLSVSGEPQPITTKPILAKIYNNATNYAMVIVGTGKYLGTQDISNQTVQSLYAIADKPNTSVGLGDVRQAKVLAERTMTQTTANNVPIRKISGTSIDWSKQQGWYMDLNPGGNSPGERINVDMDLQYNMLTAASNVPDNNVCNVGGYAWLYSINIDTGLALSTAENSAVATKLATNAMVAGIKVIYIDGKPRVIVTNSTGNPTIEKVPMPSSVLGSGRRTMWREIFD